MNHPPATGHLVEYTRLGSPRIAWVAWWSEGKELPGDKPFNPIRVGWFNAGERGRCRVSGRIIQPEDMRRTVMMRDGREVTTSIEQSSAGGFLGESPRVLRDLTEGWE